MENIKDPFLRGAWERKSEAEKGEEQESRAVKIFREMELESQKDSELDKILTQVRNDVLRYRLTIHNLFHARQETAQKEDVELRDRYRRLAHNRLVDDVNLLSRQFRQRGLNNRWREEIGLTNEQIGTWAEELEL